VLVSAGMGVADEAPGVSVLGRCTVDKEMATSIDGGLALRSDGMNANGSTHEGRPCHMRCRYTSRQTEAGAIRVHALMNRAAIARKDYAN
jgi:hypothetical protein